MLSYTLYFTADTKAKNVIHLGAARVQKKKKKKRKTENQRKKKNLFGIFSVRREPATRHT